MYCSQILAGVPNNKNTIRDLKRELHNISGKLKYIALRSNHESRGCNLSRIGPTTFVVLLGHRSCDIALQHISYKPDEKTSFVLRSAKMASAGSSVPGAATITSMSARSPTELTQIPSHAESSSAKRDLASWWKGFKKHNGSPKLEPSGGMTRHQIYEAEH